MGTKQLFAPIPLRAMMLPLSGLQFRVLACVAAHDRMSLVSGKGQGCRASNARMKAMISCSYARLCSTLMELVDLGLLAREKLGRHTIYRVIYNDEDRLLFGNVSLRSVGCQPVGEGVSKGCNSFDETGGKPPITSGQYIPLNGVRDFVETREESSLERAQFSPIRSATQSSLANNIGGQLALLERQLDAGELTDIAGAYRWLGTIMDHSAEPDANYARAFRLSEQLEELGYDEQWS